MANFTDWLQSTASDVIEKAADAQYVQPFELKQAQLSAQQNQQGQTYIPGQAGVKPAATAGFKLTPMMMIGGAVLLVGAVLLMRRG